VFGGVDCVPLVVSVAPLGRRMPTGGCYEFAWLIRCKSVFMRGAGVLSG